MELAILAWDINYALHQDFVLVDSLDIDFGTGLCVLTGETGAGKSILLDALSLAIGARADASQVRGGRDAKACITATFELQDQHTVMQRLIDHDIPLPPGGGPLILRRTQLPLMVAVVRT